MNFLKIQALFALVSHLSERAIPFLLETLKDDPIFKSDYIEGLYVLKNYMMLKMKK